MRRYVIRRLLLLFPVLLGVAAVIFFSIRLVPGDAVSAQLQGALNPSKEEIARMRADLGLDKPAGQQFFVWLGRVVKGDLGDSFYTRKPVVNEIKNAIPVTVELAVMAMVIGIVIAIPLGVLSAVRQDSWVDYVSRLFSVGGLSVPDFVLGTIILIMPAVWFGYLPPLSYIPFMDDPLRNLQQFILPSAALGLRLSATTMRMTRSSMLEVLRQDYIRTAWAKGLKGRVVIMRHALKNAMIAPITIIGAQFGFLLGGTVVIEQVFGLPGLGRLTLNAIFFRDYPQIQANVLLLATAFVIVNLLVDLSYGWFDPRIRYG